MKKKKTAKEYMSREKEYVYTTTVDMEGPVIKKGLNGPWFEDIEGRKFLDFTSQISLLNTGYNCPDVEYFLDHQRRALYSGISADWPFYNEVPRLGSNFAEVSRAALAKKLIEITGGIMPFNKKVLLEVSGATALNAAMKLAKISFRRKHTSYAKLRLEKSLNEDIFIPCHHDDFRFSFLTFKNAFGGRHGDTQCITNSKTAQLWAASSSCAFGRLSVPSDKHKWQDIKSEVDYILGRIINHAPVVAFVFEPVQGEGGINVPNKNGLNLLVKYLKRRGIYIIADEIQAGLGRTGKLFACEHFDIQPDMIVLSKSLGAGLPIGAVVANIDKFPDLEPGMHSGSHHCAPMACAAAMSNLEVLQRNIFHAEEMGKYAMESLRKIGKKFPRKIKEVRGLGLMLGVDFHSAETRKAVVKKAQDRCLLLAGCGNSVIRVCPPILIEKDDLEYGLKIFEEVLKEI